MFLLNFLAPINILLCKTAKYLLMVMRLMLGQEEKIFMHKCPEEYMNILLPKFFLFIQVSPQIVTIVLFQYAQVRILVPNKLNMLYILGLDLDLNLQ